MALGPRRGRGIAQISALIESPGVVAQRSALHASLSASWTAP